MPKYKVGDKVRVIGLPNELYAGNSCPREMSGLVGVIKEVSTDMNRIEYLVEVDKEVEYDRSWWVLEQHLELVERSKDWKLEKEEGWRQDLQDNSVQYTKYVVTDGIKAYITECEDDAKWLVEKLNNPL